jgi:hypothetical protein
MTTVTSKKQLKSGELEVEKSPTKLQNGSETDSSGLEEGMVLLG